MTEPICPSCYIEDIPLQRYQLGYRTCLTCGEKNAKKVKHIVAPLSKSNYMLFTDVNLLKQLNPKHINF